MSSGTASASAVESRGVIGVPAQFRDGGALFAHGSRQTIPTESPGLFIPSRGELSLLERGYADHLRPRP